MAKVIRVFLDCSHIYEQDIRTGIQRVVRNILNFCGKVGTESGISCQPIRWARGNFYPVSWPSPEDPKAKVRGPVSVNTRVKSTFQRLLPERIYTVLEFAFHKAQRLIEPLKREIPTANTPNAVQFGEGDVLILLDSSWHLPYWGSVRAARRGGARVGFVVYDLSPIRLPKHARSGVKRTFKEWLSNAMLHTDFCLTISETTRRDLEKYISEEGVGKHLKISSFREGVGLDRLDKRGEIRGELRDLFSENRSVYISVGTLEPRKNHNFLIDAFERAWGRGFKIGLCIIGKAGWRGGIIERIDSHPERNKLLFMFNDLTDTELEFCYQNAKALVLSSVMEGFGLPVIEALSYGLPVFASDIPSFREIGKEFCAYFSLESPKYLADLIFGFEKTGRYPARCLPSEFRWPTWEESTREFLEKARRLAWGQK